MPVITAATIATAAVTADVIVAVTATAATPPPLPCKIGQEEKDEEQEQEQEENDVHWNEYDHHNGAGSRQAALKDAFVLFPSTDDSNENENDDDHDEFMFTFPILDGNNNNKNNSIKLEPLWIRGQSSCGQTKVFQSTGLGVWSGEQMAQYLVASADRHIFGSQPQQQLQQSQQQQQSAITTTLEDNKKIPKRQILELGSGTGIAGIVAHQLAASAVHNVDVKVVWTDGDEATLENLRYNVARNTQALTTTTEADAPSTSSSSSSIRWHCPQLIWGQQLTRFRSNYGRFNVILASDCIYMEKCVDAFWMTIEALLVDEKSNSDNGNGNGKESMEEGGVVIYVNTCISQVSYEYVRKVALKYDLEDFEEPQPDVHLFRRLSRRS